MEDYGSSREGRRISGFLLLAALHEDERAEAEVGKQPADEFPRELQADGGDDGGEEEDKLTILRDVTLWNCESGARQMSDAMGMNFPSACETKSSCNGFILPSESD